MIRNWY